MKNKVKEETVLKTKKNTDTFKNTKKQSSQLNIKAYVINEKANSKPKPNFVRKEKKFDTVKVEKRIDRIISQAPSEKQLLKNSSRFSASSLINLKQNSTKTPSNNYSLDYQNKNNYNNFKKPVSPKVDQSTFFHASDPKRISSEFTTNSTEMNALTDNNFNDSLLRNSDSTQLSLRNSNYNNSFNQYGNRAQSEISSKKLSMFKNSSYSEQSTLRHNNDISNKLIDLLDRMNNFMTLICKDPSQLSYASNNNPFSSSPNFDNILSSSNELTKLFSDDIDIMLNHRTSSDSLMKLELSRKASYDVDSIYRSCCDIKEQIFKKIDSEESFDEMTDEKTLRNVEEITKSSDFIMELYIRLFQKCNFCFFDIKNQMTELGEEECDNRVFIFKHKKSISSADIIKGSMSGNNVQNDYNENKEMIKKKDDLDGLKQKMEQLKILKQKKAQLLIKPEMKPIAEKMLSTPYQLKRKGTNFTEGDNSESILNEDILINMPQSTIGEVNKPKDPTGFRPYNEDEDLSFRDDSQIIINFNNLKYKNKHFLEFNEDSEFEKTVNDTVMDTNSVVKSHRRSRSQIIKKQAGSYIIQSDHLKKNFNEAKGDLEENNCPRTTNKKHTEIIKNSGIKETKCLIY